MHVPAHMRIALYECVRVADGHSLAFPISPVSSQPSLTRGNHSRSLSPSLLMPLTSSPAIRRWLPPCKVHLIPVEILSEIFLLVEIDWKTNHKDLVLVCWRWHGVILSIPGIISQLWIRRSTKGEVVQVFIQGRRSRLTVIVDMNNERHGQDFNADAFHASFMAVIQAAPRWESLNIISFPPPGEYKASHPTVEPLKNLRSFSISHGCDLGKFFEPLLTAITTTAPHLISLELCNSLAVLYLVQPARIYVFCSLTTLEIRMPRRMESHLDILPHLQSVQYFKLGIFCSQFIHLMPPFLLSRPSTTCI